MTAPCASAQVIGATHSKLIVHVAKTPDGRAQSHQSKLVVLSRVRSWADLAVLSEPGFDYVAFLSSIKLDPDLGVWGTLCRAPRLVKQRRQRYRQILGLTRAAKRRQAPWG